MIDISGYGLLRDDFMQDTPDSDIYEAYEMSGIKTNQKIDLTKANIKSKFLVASPQDLGILDSKSYSVLTKYLRWMSMRIGEILSYWARDDEEDPNRLDTVERAFNSDFLQFKETHDYCEFNLYPILNYDLLDVGIPLPNVDYKRLFFDKLILGQNTFLDNIKNYGPLYNISVDNIPSLNKIILLQQKIYNLNIDFEEDKLPNLFKIIKIENVADPSSKVEEIMITFRVAPHFRNINATYLAENTQVYIPELVIRFSLRIDKAAFLKDLIKYQLTKQIENSDSIELTRINFWTVVDTDLKAYKVWEFNKTKGYFHTKNNQLDNYLVYGEDEMYNLDARWLIQWPFGNVHDEGNPCIRFSKIATGPISIDTIVNSGMKINLTRLIVGLYDDFMGSNFNTDLVVSAFIPKKIYLQYLAFKESFRKMENGREMFAEAIKEMRIENKSFKNNNEKDIDSELRDYLRDFYEN